MEFSRLLKKHDMSLGAYNGANKRRFVLFEKENDEITRRLEFDTVRERKSYVLATLKRRALIGNSTGANRMKHFPDTAYFLECGCCGGWHHKNLPGSVDCRDNAHRFTSDELDAHYGANVWDYETIEDQHDREAQSYSPSARTMGNPTGKH